MLHLGHHRPPQGRALHPPLQLPAHPARAAGRRDRADRRATSLLLAVPMFHANGWGLPFAAPAAGAKLVLPGRPTDGASLARLMRDEGVTVAVGVQTVWLGVVDHLDATGGDLPALEARADRRLELSRRADPAAGGAAGRRRADQLGHDRAVAAGHHRAAPTRRPANARLGAAADGPRPQAHRRRRRDPCPSSAASLGHLKVKGASVDRPLFQGRRATRSTTRAISTPATWRRSTRRAISPSAGAPRI